MSDPLPILAHGESYAQPVQKKTGGGSKPRPHEYEEARNRLLANIGAVSRQMQTDPDSYLEEKVVCIRMEPKFEAKSYAPRRFSPLRTSCKSSAAGDTRQATCNLRRTVMTKMQESSSSSQSSTSCARPQRVLPILKTRFAPGQTNRTHGATR